jgi:hypothetical protein
MDSKIEVKTIESWLNADNDGRIDIEQMGEDANIYYDITDTQSARYSVGSVFIGKEPNGYDHRGKLMLYEFGEKTVLVVDTPQERQDILITGDVISELKDIAAGLIESEIVSDTVPIRIETAGDRAKPINDWVVKTYAGDVALA